MCTWEEYDRHDVPVPSHHIKGGGYISLCLTPGNVNHDHLVKVTCARFLHCQITVFRLPYFVH